MPVGNRAKEVQGQKEIKASDVELVGSEATKELDSFIIEG
jgi:hypothetical protein